MPTPWRIRQEQFDALQGTTQKIFVSHLIQHVRTTCGDRAGLPQPEMERFAHYAWQRALQSGFTTEFQVCGFAEVLFALGPVFDQDSFRDWAQEIFSVPGLSADEKIRRLVLAKDFAIVSGMVPSGTSEEYPG